MFKYLLAPCLALLLLGCNTQVEIEVAEVSGVITDCGEPLVGASVMFVPNRIRDGLERENPFSFGVTDEEGRYELSMPGGVSGATIGAHQVLVSKVVNPVQLDETKLIAEADEDDSKTATSSVDREAELTARKSRLWRMAVEVDPFKTPQPKGEIVFVGFNVETELQFEVPAGGTREANFEVGRDPMLVEIDSPGEDSESLK